MARIVPDWSRLPADLLFSIVKLLPTRIDILRFRAVCHLFRAIIPLPSEQYPFPHSVLATTDFLKGPYPDEEDLFDFTVSTVYAIDPLNKTSHTQKEETPQTWVVRVQERNPGRLVIIDPILGSECKNLTDQLPKSLNLLDYRVTEISKSYQLVSTDEEHIVIKLIFSSSLDENDDEFTVMARDNERRELGIWRNLDKKWSIINMGLQYHEVLEDIVYHNHKFYAVLPKGYTVTVDPKSLGVTRVAEELQLDWGYWTMLYLIELNNDLFLIDQFQEDDDDEPYNIALFKLNEENQKWVPVVDGLELEDRVLFVCRRRCAYSFSIKEVAGCKVRCAYYADFCSVIGDYPGQDTWICDFKDHVVGHVSGFPGYLNLFWPPPAWLKQELTASAGEKRSRGSRDDCEETSQA